MNTQKLKKEIIKSLSLAQLESVDEKGEAVIERETCRLISLFESKLEEREMEFKKTLNSGRKMYQLGKEDGRKKSRSNDYWIENTTLCHKDGRTWSDPVRAMSHLLEELRKL
jgi:hypothetical protein